MVRRLMNKQEKICVRRVHRGFAQLTISFGLFTYFSLRCSNHPNQYFSVVIGRVPSRTVSWEGEYADQKLLL